MGIPFDEINTILLDIDFENIGYGKLKHLITFFISGNRHIVNLSDVVLELKERINLEEFQEENEKALKSLSSYLSIQYVLPIIRPKFLKLLDITIKLLRAEPTGNIEDFYKTILKKNINVENENINNKILRILGMNERITRKQYNTELADVDKKIKKQKVAINGTSDENIAEDIKQLIDQYGENSKIETTFLPELGFTFQKTQTGGTPYEKTNLVGYLSVGIDYKIDEATKKITVVTNKSNATIINGLEKPIQLNVGGGSPNLNNLIIQDRIHFILLLFIIHTIATFIVSVANIKTVSQTTLLYFTIHVSALLLFVILANSNIPGVKELFYYLNTNAEDGRGVLRIILQLTCICSLIPIPYIIKDKKELNNVTLYILILASVVTLIV